MIRQRGVSALNHVMIDGALVLIPPTIAEKATATVLARARDDDDANDLLRTLGLPERKQP